MKFKLKLGKHRQRFCKKCLKDLRNGKVRVSKCYKTIVCGCGERNKWRLN